MHLTLISLVYADTARLGILVVDEVSNEPVQNVKIKANFDQNFELWKQPWVGKSEKSPISMYVSSDSRGRCEVEESTPTGEVWFRVETVPRGYYELANDVVFKSTKKNFFGTWQPDDSVITMKLERVENPIPLYVNWTTSSIGDASGWDLFTGNGERAHYDLVKDDWLPPNGTGEVADVEFVRLPHVDLGERTRSDGIRGRMYRDSMEVRFPGERNGLIEMPTEPLHTVKIRTAPEDGYGQKYVVSRWCDEEFKIRESWDNSRCFCFRIRSRTNAEGKLIDGLYGKIYRDIVALRLYSTNTIANVRMRYYLNLTPLDRNLEWNGKNLCKKPRRRVGDLR